MKRIIFTSVMFISLAVSAQKPITPIKAANTAPAVKITTSADSIQYILGAYLGLYINTNGFVISTPAIFNKGLDDALQNKPLLVNADSIPRLLDNYLKHNTAARSALQEKQLFESIKGKPGLGILPSGVCYTIIKAGLGKRPQLTDSVQVHLKGYLAGGKQFEDTYPKNSPVKTTANTVIPGMSEILQIMPAGSLWRVYIPSALGFGEKGLAGIIPPNSALIYEVELLNVSDKAPVAGGK